MKSVIKDSMKTMLVKYFANFGMERERDMKQCESYADSFVDEFERYLKAYNEFKED
jgi:hypothetical protein